MRTSPQAESDLPASNQQRLALLLDFLDDMERTDAPYAQWMADGWHNYLEGGQSLEGALGMPIQGRGSRSLRSLYRKHRADCSLADAFDDYPQSSSHNAKVEAFLQNVTEFYQSNWLLAESDGRKPDARSKTQFHLIEFFRWGGKLPTTTRTIEYALTRTIECSLKSGRD